jgi:hypothetical protein
MAADGYMYMRMIPDGTWRFCDGKNWYDDFGEYLAADEQSDFEAELWREAGRKPDAVMTVTTHGKTEEIEIYHP